MKKMVRRFLADWRLYVLVGMVVVGLTVAAVALGVNRPLRAVAQVGIGVHTIACGLLMWRNDIKEARRKTA